MFIYWQGQSLHEVFCFIVCLLNCAVVSVVTSLTGALPVILHFLTVSINSHNTDMFKSDSQNLLLWFSHPDALIKQSTLTYKCSDIERDMSDTIFVNFVEINPF